MQCDRSLWVDVSTSAEHIRQNLCCGITSSRATTGMCIQGAVFGLLLTNFIGAPNRIDLEGSVPLESDDAKLHNLTMLNCII